LFGIFLKPYSKQKYLQVEQRQLSYEFIFTICLFIDLLSSPTAKLEGWYGPRVDTRDHMENFMS
jgi:hypothetical protein